MASLIDCLIEDLTNENDGYEKLLSLSNEKTSAIVSGIDPPLPGGKDRPYLM